MNTNTHTPRSRWAVAQAIALAVTVVGAVGATTIPAAHADDRWRYNHWDRGDWRRHHPHYYVAPGYVYAPPPVVYAPQPVYPGFNLNFRF